MKGNETTDFIKILALEKFPEDLVLVYQGGCSVGAIVNFKKEREIDYSMCYMGRKVKERKK